MNRPFPLKNCAYEKCRSEYQPVHRSQKYCSHECLKAHHKMLLRQRAVATNNAARKDKIKPVRKPLSVDAKADAEQHKINMAVDKKYAVKCEGRRITGPEFHAMALQYQDRELRGNMRLNYYFHNP